MAGSKWWGRVVWMLVAGVLWGSWGGLLGEGVVRGEDPGVEQLREIFRGIMRKDGDGTAEPGKENEEEGGETHRNRRTEDRRAPYQVEQAELLERGDQRFRGKDYPAARQAWQQLLEQPEDSLFPWIPEKDAKGKAGKSKWRSIRAIAGERLRGLPEEERQAYVEQYQGIAERLLKEGDAGPDARKWGECATRYFLTPAGQEAADRLASWHLDRGETIPAASWLKRLSDEGARVCESPAWRLKGLWVARRVGDEAWEKQLQEVLLKVPAEKLVVGGEGIDLEKWGLENSTEGTRDTLAGSVREWGMFYGNAAHAGRQSAVEATLSLKWSGRLCESDQVADLVGQLEREVDEQQVAAVYAFQPLVAGDRVITRGWRGVEVRERRSGRLLWRVEDRKSAEEILLGEMQQGGEGEGGNPFPQFRAQRGPFGLNRGGMFSEDGSGEGICVPQNVMYRDYTYGLLSSDGERLFVIQELPVLTEISSGNMFGDANAKLDRYGRDPGSNQLSAYDLKTGRVLWTIGGAPIESPYELPMSGWFFRGVPVADGGELLVVAEMQGEIRLLGLNPADGSAAWSQLIGYSESEIVRDSHRQWMPAQPTVTEGVVLCPTMTGWVVAVDRLTHAVMWYHRTPVSRESIYEQQPYVELPGLGQEWAYTPLIAERGTGLYTTVDGKELRCLNLSDGALRWKLPRNEGMYVAGIVGELGIVVSQKGVSGVKLGEGELKWNLSLAKGERVSGRSVLSGNGVLLVPTREGTLVKVDCRAGKVVERKRLSEAGEGKGSLGNLLLTDEELLSVDGTEIRAFETAQSLELAKNRGRDELQPGGEGAIVAIERLLQEGNAGEAWKILRGVSREGMSNDQAGEWVKRERQVLLTGLRGGMDLTERERILEERFPVGKKIGDWELALAFAEWMKVRGEAGERWRFLVRLARAEDLEEVMLKEVGNEALEVRGDLAVSARLKQAWKESAEGERESLTAEMASGEPEWGRAAIESARRWVRVFDFHPRARVWRQGLVQRLAAEGRFHEAEQFILSHLGRGEERKQGLEQLAALMVQARIPEDAVWYRRQGGIQSTEGEGSASKSGEASLPKWGSEKLELVREGGLGGSFRPLEIPLPAGGLPSLNQWRFQVSTMQQRLIARRNSDERIDWALPLRSREFVMELRADSWIEGHLAVVEFGGMLQGISTVDRKLLWSSPVSWSAGEVEYMEEAGTSSVRPVELLKVTSENFQRQIPAAHLTFRQRVVGKSGGTICVRDRGTLTCLDAVDGRKLWSLRGISNETGVLGSGEVVYLIQGMKKEGQIRSLRDGSLVRDEKTGKPITLKRDVLERTVRIVGGDLIRKQSLSAEEELKRAKVPMTLRQVFEDGLRTKGLVDKSNLTGGKRSFSRLSRFRPASGEELWSVELPSNAVIGEVTPEVMVVVDEQEDEKKNRTWGVSRLNLQDGTMKLLGEINPKPIRSLHTGGVRILAHQAGERLYLGVNKRHQENFSDDLVSKMTVDGPLAAIDMTEGRLLWQTNVRSQGLILDKLERSPVLVLTDRKYSSLGGDGQWKRDIRVLDRETGKETFSQQITSDDQVTQVEIDGVEGGLRLMGNQQVLRLRGAKGESRVEIREGSTP